MDLEHLAFMAFNPQDHFFKKAKKEGFLARSAYKLDEIQKRFRIIRPGHRVLDLGCAPGAWSQVALKIIGDRGFVEGIDLKEVSLSAPNARFQVRDAFELTPNDYEGELFDVVLSDMAPNTTGNAFTDQARSEALCDQVLFLAQSMLKPKGNLVMKLFMGGGAKELEMKTRSMFDSFKQIRPEGTRKESKEIFLVGMGFKNGRQF
jgi:23S rRNA (uridine2552-2'-O)-methyltransferase